MYIWWKNIWKSYDIFIYVISDERVHIFCFQMTICIGINFNPFISNCRILGIATNVWIFDQKSVFEWLFWQSNISSFFNCLYFVFLIFKNALMKLKVTLFFSALQHFILNKNLTITAECSRGREGGRVTRQTYNHYTMSVSAS